MVLGEAPEAPIRVPMNGAVYLADVMGGQKTGLFYDQRPNHAFAARLSRGALVLDVFSHVGGFGLAALAGGATEVTCVDASAAALTLASGGAAAMGREIVVRQGDAFAALESLGHQGLVEAGHRRDTIFMRQGITFEVGGADGDAAVDRPFPLDLVPRILPVDEWRTIKRGLAQRIRALNRFVDDVWPSSERLRRSGCTPPCTMPNSAASLPSPSCASRERCAQRRLSSIERRATSSVAGYGVHSSKIITTRRFRSPASSPSSSSSRSIVSSRSALRRPAWNEKRSEPSLGSTSIEGTTRRLRKSSAARSSTCPIEESISE